MRSRSVSPGLIPVISCMCRGPGRTTDVAGGAHADMDLVASLGNEAEGLVEGGDVLDPGHRDLELRCDLLQGLLGEPVVLSLDLQEDLDEIAGITVVLLN